MLDIMYAKKCEKERAVGKIFRACCAFVDATLKALRPRSMTPLSAAMLYYFPLCYGIDG